ncbi:MAG: hypothetical protein AABX01_06595 [Candidatus Micrarchaeota archaeon]
MNTDFTVRLRGNSAQLLKEMIDLGYCESKTEAVRTALLRYGMELGLVNGTKMLEDVQEAIKKSGKKYSEEEVGRHIEAAR